jgi:hypothetical protein
MATFTCRLVRPATRALLSRIQADIHLYHTGIHIGSWVGVEHIFLANLQAHPLHSALQGFWQSAVANGGLLAWPNPQDVCFVDLGHHHHLVSVAQLENALAGGDDLSRAGVDLEHLSSTGSADEGAL